MSVEMHGKTYLQQIKKGPLSQEALRIYTDILPDLIHC